MRAARLRTCCEISPDNFFCVASSSAVIRPGTVASKRLAPSASRSDSSVAGMLRDTMLVVVSPMVVKA